MDDSIQQTIKELYIFSGELIKQGKLKEALESIFSFIRSCNKYVDEQKPWIQVKEDRLTCEATLYTCSQVILNLSLLLDPFLPFACRKIRHILNLDKLDYNWNYNEISAGHELRKIELLFQRIDVKQIEVEVEKLKQQNIRN